MFRASLHIFPLNPVRVFYRSPLKNVFCVQPTFTIILIGSNTY